MSSATSLPQTNEAHSAAEVLQPPLQRIQSLDVLRGIAVLAGLFTNIWLFGGFSTNRQDGLLVGPHGGNYQLFRAINILLEGKMRALIALVFGAGMLLYLFKGYQRRQLFNADFFIRRQMWLMAFGLINAVVFLWSGDLLFHLGIMGILLFPFIRLPARGLLLAAVLTMLVYCGKKYWSYADDHKVHNKYLSVVAAEKKITKDSAAKAQKRIAAGITAKDTTNKPAKDTLTKKQTEEKSAWEGLVKRMKYDAGKDAENIKNMREVSYGKIWEHLLPTTQAKEAQWTYTLGIWDLGSMILLGMALFRFGFFDPEFASKKYLLLAVAGLAIGFFLGWFRLHFQQLAIQDYDKYIVRYALPYQFFYPVEIALSALGYASLFLWLGRLSFLKVLGRGLAIAGQMALTNYLLQSIICVLFFYGFGMGYYARLQQWQLYVFAGEVIMVNLVFSVLWLRFFHYGPAEWLLRCLMYRKWLPNRINKPVAEPVVAVF